LSVIYVIVAFFFITGDYTNKQNIIYFVGSLIIFAGGIATNTRGGWIAIACSFFISTPYIITNRVYLKKYVALILASIVVFIVIDITSGGILFLNRVMPMFFQIKEISKGYISPEFGSRRFEIWMNSMGIVSKYWIIGSGPDTFTTVYRNFGFYPKDSAGKTQIIFLSAHNESLQLLITTGVFSLLTYWGIVGSIMLKGIKQINVDRKIVPLILGLICYLVKGIFNCSVVTDMIIFWVLLALINSNKIEKNVVNSL
ncbi:MAG: O-antigen ligase family protein, partial [Oscillospiraceae bacterium]